MAERLVLVCDICGSPAEQSVTFRAGARSLAQDLCSTHFQELVRRSHTPKRGRRPGVPQAAAPAAPRRGRKKATRKAAKKSTAKRARRKITDPAVLEKRLAALAKARAARAQKRAAAGSGS
jgi:hypothetical protein